MQRGARELIALVLNEGVLEVRDTKNGETPFMYTSHNFGPMKVLLKNLVGRKKNAVMNKLSLRLCGRVIDDNEKYGRTPHKNYFSFIAANATGGIVPGWIMSEHIETFCFNALTRNPIPLIYIKDGHAEEFRDIIASLNNNPEIKPGSEALVVDEVINFGKTTLKTAQIIRGAGFSARRAACFLFYDHPSSREKLKNNGIDVTYLFTASELLQVAEEEKYIPTHVAKDCRNFLENPEKWHREYHMQAMQETAGTLE